jgi:type IX secretion system PorP/SprF family membrane protein
MQKITTKYKYLLLVLAVFTIGISNAQQTQLSSLYTYNPILINPAESGYKSVTDITVNYRKQWLNYVGAPSTAFVSGHTALNKKMGLGGVLIYDEIAFMKNIDAKLNYAYHLKLAKDFRLSFGLGLGIIQNSLNFGEIRADDYTDEIISGGNISGTMFDANFGTVINFKDVKLGISLPQILQPSTQITNTNIEASYNLQSHLNVYATYEYEINNEIKMLPTVFYRQSKASSQFDVFANFMFNKNLFLGFGYRQQVGLLFNIGMLAKDKFQVNYSYDLGRQGPAVGTGGTHEIMLKYLMGKKGKNADPEDEGEEKKTFKPMEKF